MEDREYLVNRIKELEEELQEYKSYFGEVFKERKPTKEELEVMQNLFPSPMYSFFIKFNEVEGSEWLVRAKEYTLEFYDKIDEAVERLYH